MPIGQKKARTLQIFQPYILACKRCSLGRTTRRRQQSFNEVFSGDPAWARLRFFLTHRQHFPIPLERLELIRHEVGLRVQECRQSFTSLLFIRSVEAVRLADISSPRVFQKRFPWGCRKTSPHPGHTLCPSFPQQHLYTVGFWPSWERQKA